MPEYKVQNVKKSSYIILHYGIFKIGWDWLILLCTFYIAIMVPFNAAFNKNKESQWIDVAVEVLFAIGKTRLSFFKLNLRHMSQFICIDIPFIYSLPFLLDTYMWPAYFSIS